jgi:hypothetical protein
MPPTETETRAPVKREGAEQYVLLSLVSFAASVIVTRLFLQLTGYPQIGGQELHIAHVLWGGLLLFIASLLPLILANRWVFRVSAVLSGVGVGLFIDEVGKFITRSNDYFYPPAAPIIYAFFLLTVLLYLNVRNRKRTNPRRELYSILDGLTEVLDHDLDADERGELEKRLGKIAHETDSSNLERLAHNLIDFLEEEHLRLASPRLSLAQRLGQRINAVGNKYITRRKLKAFLIIALGSLGVVALIQFVLLLWSIPFHQRGIEALLLPMVSKGEIHSAREALWFIVRTILQGSTGAFLVAAGGMLTIGQEKRGIRLATLILVIWLTVINLLVFYLDQFGAVVTALVQFAVLLAVRYYLRKYL